MKRVAVPPREPKILEDFRTEHPQGTWKLKRGSGQPAFRDELGYERVYEVLAAAQGHVCAYCEIDIELGLKGQVEHFVPEDLSNGRHNFALDFGNMLACCEGGTRTDIDNDRAEPPVRDTQHCGQLKNDFDPRDTILDPRQMVASPCIWRFETSGAIAPDATACAKAGIEYAKAKFTVDALGLDRRVLRRLRAAVLEQLDAEMNLLVDGERIGDGEAIEEVAATQLIPTNGRLPAFWSTIRDWAGQAADRVLQQHARMIPGMAP